jgi:hypothetical protein
MILLAGIYYPEGYKFDLIAWKGGSLKRSLGMDSPAFIIPKTFPGYGLAFADCKSR